MKFNKIYIYATLLALPIVGILFKFLNPTQCPPHYTQAQVDAADCIVGANIGGFALFLISASIAWLTAAWFIKVILHKRNRMK